MDHYLERMERALFVKKLAFYYSEINALLLEKEALFNKCVRKI